jgi:hypothetical protein
MRTTKKNTSSSIVFTAPFNSNGNHPMLPAYILSRECVYRVYQQGIYMSHNIKLSSFEYNWSPFSFCQWQYYDMFSMSASLTYITLAQVATILTCTREEPGSNLGRYINYTDWGYLAFPQSLQPHARRVLPTQVRAISFCVLSSSLLIPTMETIYSVTAESVVKKPQRNNAVAFTPVAKQWLYKKARC